MEKIYSSEFVQKKRDFVLKLLLQFLSIMLLWFLCELASASLKNLALNGKQ